jgi:hypothetical protein
MAPPTLPAGAGLARAVCPPAAKLTQVAMTIKARTHTVNFEKERKRIDRPLHN